MIQDFAERTFFHAAPILLGEGSTILPGNFYRIRSKFEQNWSLRHLEKIFEDVRSSHYGDRPSRQNCVFLCEDK